MTFFGNIVICALVVSFAALALGARAANDTTRAQINNIPEKSHVVPLLIDKHTWTILALPEGEFTLLSENDDSKLHTCIHACIITALVRNAYRDT